MDRQRPKGSVQAVLRLDRRRRPPMASAHTANSTDPPIAPSLGPRGEAAQLAEASPSAWQLLPEQLAEPLAWMLRMAAKASVQLLRLPPWSTYWPSQNSPPSPVLSQSALQPPVQLA
jgi:hypothetical protein